MPRNKDLKRLVRARMTKTGESYTAARARITTKPAAKASHTPAAASAAKPDTANYAAIAGKRDAIMKEKTGRTWAEWALVLDRHGAKEMVHRDVAALVNAEYGVDGWWAQTVTVGYERIRGRRVTGQRLDGSYEASKSRTFDVPVTKMFDAWANASVRRRWLNGTPVKVRTATAPKSMRLGWSDGTIVAVWFTAKGESKSVVALAHTKLPDKNTADRLKQFWAERFDVLGDLLQKR
jgi:hypothetical protein